MILIWRCIVAWFWAVKVVHPVISSIRRRAFFIKTGGICSYFAPYFQENIKEVQSLTCSLLPFWCSCIRWSYPDIYTHPAMILNPSHNLSDCICYNLHGTDRNLFYSFTFPLIGCFIFHITCQEDECIQSTLIPGLDHNQVLTYMMGIGKVHSLMSDNIVLLIQLLILVLSNFQIE